MNSILDLGSVYEIRNINYVIIEVYKLEDHDCGGWGNGGWITYYHKAIPLSIIKADTYNLLDLDNRIIEFNSDDKEIMENIKKVNDTNYDVKKWTVSGFILNKK